MLVMPAQIDRSQHPVARGDQRRQRVAHQPHHQHLGLGVAEADIEFEQHRAGLGQHQPGIEDTLEGAALALHRRDRRQDDALHDPTFEHRVEARGRGTRTHPAGVRPGVAVAEALIILGGGEGQRVLAVD